MARTQNDPQVETKYIIGQYVKVFFDPLTQHDLEGDAKLVRPLQEVGIYEGRVANMWRVKFRGESNSYTRTILEPAPEVETVEREKL